MARLARTFLLLALMLTASYGISAAASDTSNTDAVAGPDTRGLTARTLDRLPESGGLLLWGTGLAVASRLVSRKGKDSED